MKDNKQTNQDATNDSFYKIYDWMYQTLGLTGSDLLVYAIIYDCNQRFENANPSVKQIKTRTGVHERTILRVLSNLENRKLVNVERIPGRPSTYSVNDVFANFARYGKMSPLSNCHPCQIVTGTPDKMSQPLCQNVTTPMTKCHTLKKTKEEKEDLKDKNAHAPVRTREDDVQNPLSPSTENEFSTEERLQTFWKLYPKSKRGNYNEVKIHFYLLDMVNDYPRLMSYLHHKLLCNDLGDDWQKNNNRYMPTATRYLAEKYWMKEVDSYKIMFEYTPEGEILSRKSPEQLREELLNDPAIKSLGIL